MAYSLSTKAEVLLPHSIETTVLCLLCLHFLLCHKFVFFLSSLLLAFALPCSCSLWLKIYVLNCFLPLDGRAASSCVASWLNVCRLSIAMLLHNEPGFLPFVKPALHERRTCPSGQITLWKKSPDEPVFQASTARSEM